jgi:hypothetical protein
MSPDGSAPRSSSSSTPEVGLQHAMPADDLRVMLPNLLVIGAQKCGTTSLHHHLSLHPEILMSEVKEIHYFSANYEKGPDWYGRHFRGAAKRVGEASTSYSFWPRFRDVPLRIRDTLGTRVRLLYSLRDPIERIRSQYLHYAHRGRHHGSLAEVLADPVLVERYNYVDTSRYASQLQQYLEVFPPQHIHVITLEELSRSPAQTMREVFAFLGVDPGFVSDQFSEVRHRSSDARPLNPLGRSLQSLPGRSAARRLVPARLREAYRSLTRGPMPDSKIRGDLRARLIDTLAPEVERLRSLTGRPFPDWCV